MSDYTTYTGHRAVTSSGSDHNVERLHIEKALAHHRTAVPVKVLKVYPDPNGGAPTADVQVMVDQVDGLGSNPTPHATVYGVTVGRVHSGSGAIVSDPVAGDLYHMAVHDRDVSKFKASGGQQSSPDTKRRGSLSDGHLTHAILSKAPPQAVVFKPGGGVKIFDKGGAIIETSADGKTVTVTNASGAAVVLQGSMTYIGGDPAKGGTFDFLMTASGPCKNAKGQTG